MDPPLINHGSGGARPGLGSPCVGGSAGRRGIADLPTGFNGIRPNPAREAARDAHVRFPPGNIAPGQGVTPKLPRPEAVERGDPATVSPSPRAASKPA